MEGMRWQRSLRMQKEILQYYFPEMDVLNIKSVNC